MNPKLTSVTNLWPPFSKGDMAETTGAPTGKMSVFSIITCTVLIKRATESTAKVTA